MSLLATLPGYLVAVLGISATVAVAWINQRGHSRRELIREEIRTRESLYAEFIAECARLLVDAYQHHSRNPKRCSPRTASSIAYASVHPQRCSPKLNG